MAKTPGSPVNELHVGKVAAELGLSSRQVAATARLLNEDATVPFIARYREEATGSLDEVGIARIRDRMLELRELDERRAAIVTSLEDIDEGVRPDRYARLFGQGVTLRPLIVATEVVAAGVHGRHTFSGAEASVEAGTVVLAFGGKAKDSLFDDLDGAAAELWLIGDAPSPRRIHDAILEGTRTARAR